ncbi:MAG TPA: response regulator [Phycisphaerales bacterium]|nr:response regulator [Phycisphaerales bacterium]
MSKILFVDDEPVICRTAKRILTRLGFDVVLAHNAEEALLVYDETEFQAVVSDVRIPGMGGLELTNELKSRNKEAVIFLCSGYMDSLPEGFPVRGFLAKPYDFKELAALLEAALHSAA